MALYSDQSMLSFEGEQFQGQQNIFNKLTSLTNVAHTITTLDCQPTTDNGILCFVCGKLTIDGGNEMMYTETFHLRQGGSQGYYVHNDIFRLNLG